MVDGGIRSTQSNSSPRQNKPGRKECANVWQDHMLLSTKDRTQTAFLHGEAGSTVNILLALKQPAQLPSLEIATVSFHDILGHRETQVVRQHSQHHPLPPPLLERARHAVSERNAASLQVSEV